ncbi:hypothetical protein DOTSEDRAFT_78964 [Dothistroma septosporum NZE10]|uniref:Uncharacterized protein n=1 Tax=Dothistroma septosporum (strain NZE10 / CBS 128990) TaxID=675120 RepID=N1PWP5_DOTSN|nr:hypothetical protein DOTSEDRAFT_78964 [Dothistroma septosporum NZE10]
MMRTLTLLQPSHAPSFSIPIVDFQMHTQTWSAARQTAHVTWTQWILQVVLLNLDRPFVTYPSLVSIRAAYLLLSATIFGLNLSALCPLVWIHDPRPVAPLGRTGTVPNGGLQLQINQANRANTALRAIQIPLWFLDTTRLIPFLLSRSWFILINLEFDYLLNSLQVAFHSDLYMQFLMLPLGQIIFKFSFAREVEIAGATHFDSSIHGTATLLSNGRARSKARDACGSQYHQGITGHGWAWQKLAMAVDDLVIGQVIGAAHEVRETKAMPSQDYLRQFFDAEEREAIWGLTKLKPAAAVAKKYGG